MGILISIIKSNWQLLLVLVATGFVCLLVWNDGYSQCKIDQKLKEADQTIHILATERKASDISSGVDSGHQINIANINSAYDSVLSSSYNLPSVPEPPRINHDTPCAGKLPESNRRLILNAGRQCDLQTARLISCQAWIRQQKANQ